jgi:hypothetical protein
MQQQQRTMYIGGTEHTLIGRQRRVCRCTQQKQCQQMHHSATMYTCTAVVCSLSAATVARTAQEMDLCSHRLASRQVLLAESHCCHLLPVCAASPCAPHPAGCRVLPVHHLPPGGQALHAHRPQRPAAGEGGGHMGAAWRGSRLAWCAAWCKSCMHGSLLVAQVPHHVVWCAAVRRLARLMFSYT